MGQIKFKDEEFVDLQLSDQIYGKMIEKEKSQFYEIAPLNYHVTLKDMWGMSWGLQTYKAINEKSKESICHKHSGKPINEIGKSMICHRAYNQQLFYKKVVPLKEKCKLLNNSLIDNMILNQYLYLKRLRNPRFMEAKLSFIKSYEDALFYADQKHRIQIATQLTYKDADICPKEKIEKMEDINYDFLINVNYILTPSIIKVVERVPNLSTKLRRSQIIMAGIALNEDRYISVSISHSSKNKIGYEDVLKMNARQFKEFREKGQKKLGKLDFRKTKDIRKFVYNYRS